VPSITKIATVDDAGYVSIPFIRGKVPTGRYALLSKSGNGVSVNLEYLIQIGATAELILDHGWSPQAVGFERGEFDAVTYEDNDEVVLAMKANSPGGRPGQPGEAGPGVAAPHGEPASGACHQHEPKVR
jgi:hypothetical protein